MLYKSIFLYNYFSECPDQHSVTAIRDLFGCHGWLRWDLMLNNQRGEVTEKLTSWV
jgi:hypothetical protein